MAVFLPYIFVKFSKSYAKRKKATLLLDGETSFNGISFSSVVEKIGEVCFNSAMTLLDKEFQKIRNSSILCLRTIGVKTGGSNVQFAVNLA